MTTIIELLKNTFHDSTKMVIFNKFKTNDPIIDALISTVILSFIGYIINYVYERNIDISLLFKPSNLKYYFCKKNIIILEGKKSSTTSAYTSSYMVTALYSNRFKAIWDYIINRINKNETIYQIKEIYSNRVTNIYSSNKELDIYMVSQDKHFLIDDDIYIETYVDQEDDRIKEEKITTKIDKIILKIYSYKHSLDKLRKYVDDITEKYLQNLKENRLNKKFIYSLYKVDTIDGENMYNCWKEYLFKSARIFDNVFFDNKKEFIEKIDFFMKQEKWYNDIGCPYSLGIGLHGPPGTGKTSLIKAIANYTNRHIILLSLKLIKTKKQLDEFFFEDTYNSDNEKKSITFDKKIIVIEDIDCIGDIILKREEQKTVKFKQMKKEKYIKNYNNDNDNDSDNNNVLGDVLQSIVDINNVNSISLTNKEELITLDDILNLWDGIRETPGRMLIISSNHYFKLDPALIRPGRIDITLELNKASHNTISEMYKHIFKKEINKKMLKKIKEYHFSPAELINIYISNKNSDDFLKALIQSTF